MNIEESLEAIRAIIEAMEDGSLSLEEQLEQFEKGVSLVKSCGRMLESAEQKIQIIEKEDVQ